MNLNGIINSIEANAAANTYIDAKDFIKDDLLHCGKCGTAKQVRVEILGVVRTPYCLCKCEAERLAEEKAELKRQEEQERIKDLRKMGFPDAEMRNWTFANDDGSNPKITAAAKRYVAGFPEFRNRGKGLLFYGSVGTGKTYISACIANALIDQGYSCLVTNFARLVNTISGTFEGKQDYIDGLNRFSLLVIDDLAAERDTEYMNEIVYNIIDSRYRSGLPLIVTTNLTAVELSRPSQMSKQRTYSRLLEMCVPVEVSGKDRRKQKLRDDMDDMKNMLGL